MFVLFGNMVMFFLFFFFSSRRRHTRLVSDWSSDVCSSDLVGQRPRGIELSRDGKFLLVAVGDDDTIQMIDTTTHEIVANRSEERRVGKECRSRWARYH